MSIPYNVMNRDMLQQQTAAVMASLTTALEKGDTEAAATAFQQFQENIVSNIEAAFEQYKDVTDTTVLASRGLRTLTSEETEWYQKFIDAHKSANPKQAITNLTAAMPITFVDRVIEDMKKAHPLLGELRIQNAAGMIRMILNATQMSSKMGSWGALGSAITQQLSGQIKVIDVISAKYSAYFLIPKDFTRFNFGHAPMWVDQYIRLILSESIAYGLEAGAVSGDGNGKPAGMIMDLSTQTNNAYSAKTAVAITDFNDSYSDVVADLAVDENGDYRDVPELLLVVNPKDYIKTVRRWQNAVTSAGVLDLISISYPTKVVPCAKMALGKAVVGIADNYFLAINGGESGIIEYDDSAQFLDDNRVYTTRVYGNGRPVDNTSFIYLDISGVGAPAVPVEIIGTVATEEQTGGEG